MKYIINTNQYGYLIKDGQFQKLLKCGKHHYSTWAGYTVKIVDVEKNERVDTLDIPLHILLTDPDFREATAFLQLPPLCAVAHHVDGVFHGMLTGVQCIYWNEWHKHTFTLFDMSKPEVDPEIPAHVLTNISSSFLHKVAVEDGSVALLYFDKRFERVLTSGTYCFWTSNVQVSHKIVDMRVLQHDITGQEILTADKVAIRLNAVFTFRIVDAVTATHKFRDISAMVYSTVQLILREYVSQMTMDQILEQKSEIGTYVLRKMVEKQEELCVEFGFMGVKDVVLPGEIRQIMNTVLIAEKTAQAKVITRREEVASTRSLLNTAKLMDENETLYKLKELEYLEKICDKVGTISLSGAGNILEQLKTLTTSK